MSNSSGVNIGRKYFPIMKNNEDLLFLQRYVSHTHLREFFFEENNTKRLKIIAIKNHIINLLQICIERQKYQILTSSTDEWIPMMKSWTAQGRPLLPARTTSGSGTGAAQQCC